jgi:dihydrodipicolinate synthase/N-acetylneuraminate lyase
MITTVFTMLATLGVAPEAAAETVLYLGDPQIGFSGNATEDAIRFGLGADAAKAAGATAVVVAGDLVNSWDSASQIALFKEVWPSRFAAAGRRRPSHAGQP